MPTQLVYGQVQLSAMNWPLYVAQERGFFAAEDLVVQAKIFTVPPDPVRKSVCYPFRSGPALSISMRRITRR